MCEMTDVLEFPDKWECVICGHEWPREAQPDAPDALRVVKDAHGNVLANGDCIILIKDLKLVGGNQVLKGGTKSKPIRLVDGDHEIGCKMDGMAIGLKACFVKKLDSRFWRPLHAGQFLGQLRRVNRIAEMISLDRFHKMKWWTRIPRISTN